MRRRIRSAIALCAAAAAMAVGAVPASAEIVFDGSPGTAAPPDTLGPYDMTTYTDDPRPNRSTVNSVPDFPGGELSYSRALSLRAIGNGWATWSHGYRGDVYVTSPGTEVTMTLPAGTGAFYFYAEPGQFGAHSVEATSDDGTTSGPVPVRGDFGATYFGFYATDAGETIAEVKLTVASSGRGFGVGEFGWARTQTCAEERGGSGEQGPVSGIVHGIDEGLGNEDGAGALMHGVNCDVVAELGL